jgi:hypothetical protein
VPQFNRYYDVYTTHNYTVAIPRKRGNKNAKRPTDNTVKGVLSSKSKKKIREVLCGWNEALRCAGQANRAKWRIMPRFTMLTLTLASTQIHTDEEIKTKLLNPFLTELKKALGDVEITVKSKMKDGTVVEKKKKVSNLLYLWSAEAQHNESGNIHFHIVTDRYIDKGWAREVWNRIQDRLGYVERSGYTSPPSTDIRTRNIDKKSVEYLMKYITKKGKKTREIDGKLWGCSQALLKIKVQVKGDYDSVDVQMLESEATRLGLKIICPNAHVIFIPHNAKELALFMGDGIFNELEDSAREEYKKIAVYVESYRYVKFNST